MRTAMLTAAILSACLCFNLVSAAPAQPAYQHPLTDLPPAGDGISTGYYFPDYPKKVVLPAGELVSVVLGVRNEGSTSYNITAVMGSLNSPNDFRMYLQNFTQQLYLQMLDPGQELSVEYKFMPAKEVPPRDYAVALTLFYYDPQHVLKSSTFFNQTVEIVEKKKLVDTDLIQLYLLLLGVFSAAGYFLLQYVQGLGFLKGVGKKSRKVEVSTRDSDDEWIKGSRYETFKVKQAKGVAVRTASGTTTVAGGKKLQ